jgi:SAM-dependent methyltransferase
VVTASDISPELIALAKKKDTKSMYHVAEAAQQIFVKNDSMDAVLAVLTLQNMKDLAPVIKEVSRVLRKGGRFVFVINHPSFRIPKSTHWEFDGKKNMQYRRVEKYMTQHMIPIDMTPGNSKSVHTNTLTFHHPLSVFVNLLSKNGLYVSQLDELISHKTSVGVRGVPENISRREFPLFMLVCSVKV